MAYPQSRVYEFQYSFDSDEEITYHEYKNMVKNKIFDIIEFPYKYTIFYLDIDNIINYFQIDNIRNFQAHEFYITSYCSLFINNERKLKHFEDKEELKMYLNYFIN